MSRVLPPVRLAALLTTTLLVAGCGGVDAPPSAVESGSPRPSAAANSGASPTSPSTPSASPKPSRKPVDQGKNGGGKGRDGGTKIAPMLPVARPDGSRAHLLPATALPGTWTTVATTPEKPRPVGACQKASLVDIGALHAVVRSYEGADDSGLLARQVVARFADSKSAWRAHEVLRTWRDDCEEWIEAKNPSVTPMESVDTDLGTGAHYRASFGPKKDTDASGLGIVRKGKWLTIVAVNDVSAAWTKRAVRRIAATF